MPGQRRLISDGVSRSTGMPRAIEVRSEAASKPSARCEPQRAGLAEDRPADRLSERDPLLARLPRPAGVERVVAVLARMTRVASPELPSVLPAP